MSSSLGDRVTKVNSFSKNFPPPPPLFVRRYSGRMHSYNCTGVVLVNEQRPIYIYIKCTAKGERSGFNSLFSGGNSSEGMLLQLIIVKGNSYWPSSSLISLHLHLHLHPVCVIFASPYLLTARMYMMIEGCSVSEKNHLFLLANTAPAMDGGTRSFWLLFPVIFFERLYTKLWQACCCMPKSAHDSPRNKALASDISMAFDLVIATLAPWSGTFLTMVDDTVSVIHQMALRYCIMGRQKAHGGLFWFRLAKKANGCPWKMWNFQDYFIHFDGKRLWNTQIYNALHMYPNFVVRMPSEMGLLDGQTLCIICQ